MDFKKKYIKYKLKNIKLIEKLNLLLNKFKKKLLINN